MNVNLFLDQPRNHFTNLDEITGRVVLKTLTAQSVSNVTVKLEGEARTRLISQGRPGHNDKPRPVLEVHKVWSGTAVMRRQELMEDSCSTRSIPYGHRQRWLKLDTSVATPSHLASTNTHLLSR